MIKIFKNFLQAIELEPGESLPPAFGACTCWHTTHIQQQQDCDQNCFSISGKSKVSATQQEQFLAKAHISGCPDYHHPCWTASGSSTPALRLRAPLQRNPLGNSTWSRYHRISKSNECPQNSSLRFLKATYLGLTEAYGRHKCENRWGRKVGWQHGAGQPRAGGSSKSSDCSLITSEIVL